MAWAAWKLGVGVHVAEGGHAGALVDAGHDLVGRGDGVDLEGEQAEPELLEVGEERVLGGGGELEGDALEVEDRCLPCRRGGR
jgi:hypothetical protein